jgi:hypothetical protein
MSNSIDTTLAQIYDLIEVNDLEQARAMLKTLLDTDRDNPDVWWLYAHAVSEPETARMALNSVLHLDPGYPQVKELLARLNTSIGDATFDDTTNEPAFLSLPNQVASQSRQYSNLPLPPAILPGEFATPILNSKVEAASNKAKPDQLPFYRRPGCLFAVALAAALVIAIFGILRLLNQQPTAPNTQNVGGTPAETSTMIEQLGFEGETTISPEVVSTIAGAFSAFTIQENGIAEEETILGKTLVARICTVPGLEMRNTLLQSMDIVAHQVDIKDGIEAVGVQVWDCSIDAILRYIAVSRDVSVEYVNNSLSQEAFEAAWVPVG